MKFRFQFIIGCTALVFLFVIYSLYLLQIDSNGQFTARAQRIAGLRAAERGGINFTDKNNSVIPAAFNKEYWSIFAVPAEFDDIPETIGRISELLQLDPDALALQLNKPSDQYELLIAKASDEQVDLVQNVQFKGLYATTRRARYYPFDSLASQVIGFVSQGDEQDLPTGQYGIEQEYDEVLAGVAGSIDKREQFVPGIPGKLINLTIDRDIQSRAEEVLAALVKEHNAIGGDVIVQESATGKILAIANVPGFDPNEYGKSPLKNFVNEAVQGLYEPGSVFKVVTMAIGIDTGAITPETTFYDTGSFTADGKTIKNWDLKAHGTITMTNVIEQSVNTGTVFAEKKIGHKTFYDYLVKFGIKELTGIDLPGETAGRLTPLELYPRDINFATASYGQGVSMTPIRLITAISAIANGGVLHQPYVIQGGQSSQTRRVISESSARQVTDMMVSAVDKASVAAISHYRIAGKTGTAFVPDFTNGGYTHKVINTYVGFAPACGKLSQPNCNARFTVLIKLNEPENAPLAGTTVVPAFKEIAQFLLNYYNVPPEIGVEGGN